jgi:hypothetical protein
MSVTNPHEFLLAQHELAMKTLLEQFQGSLDSQQREFLAQRISRGEKDMEARKAQCLADFQESLSKLEARVEVNPGRSTLHDRMRKSIHSQLEMSLNVIEGVWQSTLKAYHALL